jgi:copper(I)-binding protein
MTLRRLATLLLLPLLLLAVAGCSSSGGATGGKLTVTGAWVRVPATPDQTAAYLTVTNGTSNEDALVGVSTTAATSASLHETTTSSGMTGMQMTASVKIPAGQTVELKPGGYHIMLMGVIGDLKAGSTVELVLTFEHAGVVKVTAEVRAS